MKETCNRCQHWQPLTVHDATVRANLCAAAEAGFCHRYPPILDPAADMTDDRQNCNSPLSWVSPVTWRDWHCGEYVEAAEKLRK